MANNAEVINDFAPFMYVICHRRDCSDKLLEQLIYMCRKYGVESIMNCIKQTLYDECDNRYFDYDVNLLKIICKEITVSIDQMIDIMVDESDIIKTLEDVPIQPGDLKAALLTSDRIDGYGDINTKYNYLLKYDNIFEITIDILSEKNISVCFLISLLNQMLKQKKYIRMLAKLPPLLIYKIRNIQINSMTFNNLFIIAVLAEYYFKNKFICTIIKYNRNYPPMHYVTRQTFVMKKFMCINMFKYNIGMEIDLVKCISDIINTIKILSVRSIIHTYLQ